MFYWIKKNRLIIISDNKIEIEVDKWIESDILFWIYKNGKIIEKKNSYEKQEKIAQYKNIQKEIQDIKAEISDYEERFETLEKEWKALAQARIWVLNTRLEEKRTESDTLSLEWIEKFWEEIISEF